MGEVNTSPLLIGVAEQKLLEQMRDSGRLAVFQRNNLEIALDFGHSGDGDRF